MNLKQLTDILSNTKREVVLSSLIKALNEGMPPSKYNRLSKGGKIHAQVPFMGTKVKVLLALESIASHMPKMYDKGTTKKINHYEVMKNRYLNLGMGSVMVYIDTVEAVILNRVAEYGKESSKDDTARHIGIASEGDINKPKA